MRKKRERTRADQPSLIKGKVGEGESTMIGWKIGIFHRASSTERTADEPEQVVTRRVFLTKTAVFGKLFPRRNEGSEGD